MSEGVFVKRKELAAMLRVGVSTFDRLKAGGKIPEPLRVGRSLRWRRDDVERWIAAGCPVAKEWTEREKRRKPS